MSEEVNVLEWLRMVEADHARASRDYDTRGALVYQFALVNTLSELINLVLIPSGNERLIEAAKTVRRNILKS